MCFAKTPLCNSRVNPELTLKTISHSHHEKSLPWTGLSRHAPHQPGFSATNPGIARAFPHPPSPVLCPPPAGL